MTYVYAFKLYIAIYILQLLYVACILAEGCVAHESVPELVVLPLALLPGPVRLWHVCSERMLAEQTFSVRSEHSKVDIRR